MTEFPLQAAPFRDPARAARNLENLNRTLGPTRAAELLPQLKRLLPKSPDPDMALNHFESFLATPHGQQQFPNLLAPTPRGLEIVLQLLGVSQFFGDVLTIDPEAFESIRAAPRRNPTTDEQTAKLKAEVEAATDDTGVLRAFRRFRQREMLRIGINDLIRDKSLEEITRELSRIADSSIKIALAQSLKVTTKRFGTPMAPNGEPARIAGFAFGKLGGDELNYSSDIDLMFVYDRDGETNKKTGGTTNEEFFARTITELVRLLSSVTDRGFAYRVDLRLRPEGKAGPLARSLASTRSYYDLRGRTWERQALIKLRPVAGDRELRKEVMDALEPFVYRKYFSFSEINEVKALKRKMEQNATKAGIDDTDVKLGRGGIRDIEYTVQFLQLLNGGDLPAVRQRNSLLALESLEIAGCLTPQETYLLSDSYRFLRRTEHRLQLLFDLQTHKLPTQPDELRKLAKRMGYREVAPPVAVNELTPPEDGPRPLLPAQRRSLIDEIPEPPELDTRDLLLDPLELFLKDFHDKTALNRTILDHLLHQTFGAADDGLAEPESDLLLDPDPDEASLKAVFGRYPFRDPRGAYQNLSRLAQEAVPFLSHRRCRHFLASIAPQLLRAVAETPDPDGALNNLERVTASLGAKAVLYELFSAYPACLRLYVDLCASSPYLSGILTNNPGMIDELLDSLVLDQPRPATELREELAELLRGAHDIDPILHSFQDKELLRIGVRDLLGKADIRATTAALSDLAESILNAVFDRTEPAVQMKLGRPTTAKGEECPYALIGLGKLGGREISYHSDLDVILIYAEDGSTEALEPGRFESTTNHHYFTTIAQQAMKIANRTGPRGRLYDVDMRLRPTGKSGSLVLSLCEFEKYFSGGGAQLWERQSLCRARLLRGESAFGELLARVIRNAVLFKPWTESQADEIASMRLKLEASSSPRSLKRGRGGLADIEFLVQHLQLKYGGETLAANVWDALEELARAGLLTTEESDGLRAGYSFLRFLESRLRIVTDRPLTEVPEAAEDLEKLARRTEYKTTEAFLAEWNRHRENVRAICECVTKREKGRIAPPLAWIAGSFTS